MINDRYNKKSRIIHNTKKDIFDNILIQLDDENDSYPNW